MKRTGNRFRENRRKKTYLQEVRRTYPLFLDEILLYMNAGLIFENAIFEIDDAHCAQSESNLFYGELHSVVSAAKQSNQNLDAGFHHWARKTGVPEIMRFSGICHDVIHKGVDAYEKIETESALSRQEIMRDIDERGRMAETKLAFPMTLMLAALLLLTIAPVFMEMNR